MSPHAVNTFVSDLVIMAQATEKLPLVEAECERLKLEVASYAEAVQRLELKLLARNDDIDGLNSRIRSLEVERDDASFRELEAIDKVDAVKSVVETIIRQAEFLNETLFPKPIEAVNLEAIAQPLKVEEHVELPKASDWVPSQGQSEVDPTAVSALGNQSPTVASQPADSGEDAKLPSGPYSDRYYIDYPGWVSREDWKAGGGTDASYDYRHDAPYNPGVSTQR